MKTMDLIYENQKLLNAIEEMLLQTKKHVEFLAVNAPEIRNNLESIAEGLAAVAQSMETQIVFNRDTLIKFAKECAAKRQAYDFIATEKLIGRFKTFCECHPTNLYAGLFGSDIMQGK